MKPNNNESDKAFTVRIPLWKWKKWKSQAKKRNLSLNSYIKLAVDELENPIKGNSSQNLIELQIRLEKLQADMKQSLDLHNQQWSRHLKNLEQTAENSPKDQKVQDAILSILTKFSPASEYFIAKEINEDTDIVFAILSYLSSIKRVKQTKEYKWELWEQ